ncbi:MAG: hypothetical protein V1907_03970 [Candidatus Kerfeldbacteria bacterium]
MKHRQIAIVTVAVLIILASSVSAATQRTINGKLGGKSGDVFKLVGEFFASKLRVTGNFRLDGYAYRGTKAGSGDTKPFIINDNLEVKGNIVTANNLSAGTLTASSLTVNNLPVSGGKEYGGTIDTAASGEYIATYASPSPCAVTKATYYHWKSISVPEVKLSPISDVHVYWKASYIGGPYTPDFYPNSGDSWTSAGFTLTDGTVWVLYKWVTEACNGTLSTLVWTDGPYKIIVQ